MAITRRIPEVHRCPIPSIASWLGQDRLSGWPHGVADAGCRHPGTPTGSPTRASSYRTASPSTNDRCSLLARRRRGIPLLPAMAVQACKHPDDRRSHLVHRRRTFPNRRVSAGSADSVGHVSARSKLWRQRASHHGKERVAETILKQPLTGHSADTPPTAKHVENLINRSHDTSQY